MQTEDDEKQTLAIAALTAMGYRVSEPIPGEGCVAIAGALQLEGSSPLVTLGLHQLLVERGWEWRHRDGERDLEKEMLEAEDGVWFEETERA